MPDITKIDPNFRADAIPYDDIVWHNAMEDPFSIHGLYEPRKTGRYTRLPLEFEHDERVNAGVRTLMFHTAGGRIRFKTDSPYVALAVELPNVGLMAHMPLTGSSGADLYFAREGSSDEFWKKTFFPVVQDGRGLTHYSGYTVKPIEGKVEVTITLPLYNAVSKVLIGTKAGSTVEAPRKFKFEKPVAFYGSSITQGGCASRPGNNYMNHICRWLDADFINLGFSGSAKGEQCMADYIASLDLSCFVLDYDANANSFEHLNATHYDFYRRIRDAHPELPIVMVSYPSAKLPPYGSASGLMERHDLIMQNYLRGIAEGDRHLSYVDGETLYGDFDSDACTVDGSHPNDLGFYRFAQHVYPAVRKALEVIL